MLSTINCEFAMKPLSFLMILTFVFSLSSCYKIPDEYDYCTIPVTNNPNITKEKSSGGMPGMKY